MRASVVALVAVSVAAPVSVVGPAVVEPPLPEPPLPPTVVLEADDAVVLVSLDAAVLDPPSVTVPLVIESPEQLATQTPSAAIFKTLPYPRARAPKRS
ncbi:MAG: hypothetical protein H6713_35560 [Myxococcales bacterium]|nr:hypothetical protein [Myxococcales bacterium]MCB9755288.1 hypothetical protein [Myxococcales bacterium]